jgi:CRISPR-associated endonuclease Csn1
LQRFKLRRDALLRIFKSNGFISKDFKYAEEGKSSTHQSYAIRAKAASEKVSPEELVRVLLMLNKKRGYKSSRKGQDASTDGIENVGQAIDGMEVAKEMQAKNLTPGEYAFQLLSQNPKAKLSDFYSSDLENEIETILTHTSETIKIDSEVLQVIINIQKTFLSNIYKASRIL